MRRFLQSLHRSSKLICGGLPTKIIQVPAPKLKLHDNIFPRLDTEPPNIRSYKCPLRVFLITISRKDSKWDETWRSCDAWTMWVSDSMTLICSEWTFWSRAHCSSCAVLCLIFMPRDRWHMSFRSSRLLTAPAQMK